MVFTAQDNNIKDVFKNTIFLFQFMISHARKCHLVVSGSLLIFSDPFYFILKNLTIILTSYDFALRFISFSVLGYSALEKGDIPKMRPFCLRLIIKFS